MRRASAVLCLGLAACAATPDWERIDNHVVVARRDGLAVRANDADELLDDPRKAYLELLRAADEECDARRGPNEPRRLMIHVHGGLKGVHASLRSAQRAVEELDADRALDPASGEQAARRRAAWKYPIFLIWPSDIGSSSYDHLRFVRRGRWATYSGVFTLPIVLVTDLARGVALGPASLLSTWSSDAGLAFSVVSERDLYPLWRNASALEQAALQNGYRLARGNYKRGFWSQTGRFLAYWTTFLPKAVIQVFALDGIGRGGWDVMKRRTQNVFFADEEFSGRKRSALKEHLDSPGRGAFNVFVEALSEHVASNAAEEYEITLVAHSMGSMVVNRLMIEFAAERYGDLPIRNVVYMAPACSTAEATQALVPALLHDERLRFFLLTLHPLAEADEAQWSKLDLTPRGSLLEWIDAFYTDPASHTERVFGKWVNAMQAIHLFAEVRERVFFRAFDATPDSDGPTTHGGFNEHRFWDEAFWHPETFPVDPLPDDPAPRGQSRNVPLAAGA